MPDLNSFIALDQQAEDETVDLLRQNQYMAHHYGIRLPGSNAGLTSEVPEEQYLSTLMIRIDVAKKLRTDYVALVVGVDIRKGDKLFVHINGRNRKLEVSAVNSRGNAAEVELKNG